MPLENDIILFNSDTIAAIFYTLLAIAFLTVPFIIYFVKKNDSSKLINKYLQIFPNPEEAMEAYYRDKQNYSIVEPYRKNSLIAIVYYFVVMYILSNIVASIGVSIYLTANGFSKDIIDPNSAAFNPNVYDHMTTFLSPILEIVLYAILLVGVVIMLWKPLVKDLKAIKGKTFAIGAMGYGLAFAGLFIGTILFSILGITARKGDATNQEQIEAMFNSSTTAIIILFFVTVIFAPIVEELIFRKGIFTLIKDPKLAIIVSSLVFGGLHVVSSTIVAVENWIIGEATYLTVILEFVYIIQYSLMGLGFGIAYVKSNKNVCATIFAHMLNNGVSFVTMILSMILPKILPGFFETIINFII